MILNNLLCTGLGSLVEWYRFIIPGGTYHTDSILILITLCFRYNIAYTVHQTDIHGKSVIKFDCCGIIRHKFRFGGHNRFTDSCLRQFVNHA